MMYATIFNPRSIITTVMTINSILNAFLLTPLISDITKDQITKNSSFNQISLKKREIVIYNKLKPGKHLIFQ
jgi:hypothetical protein